MALPGSPAARIPLGDDWVARDLASLREQIAGLGSSLAGIAAIQAQIVAITAVQDALQAQVDFLADQTISLSSLSNWTQALSSVAGAGLQAFNGTYDLSQTITTGDSGKLALSFGAQMIVKPGPQNYVAAGMTVQAMLGASLIYQADPYAMNKLENYSTASALRSVVTASNSVAVAALAPNTTYTIRTRRYFDVDATTLGATIASEVGVYGPSLTITRVGM